MKRLDWHFYCPVGHATYAKQLSVAFGLPVPIQCMICPTCEKAGSPTLATFDGVICGTDWEQAWRDAGRH